MSSAGVAILDSIITTAQMFIVLIGASFIRELFGLGTLLTDINSRGGITVFTDAPLPILTSTAGVLLLAGIAGAIAKLIVKNKSKAAKAATRKNS